MPYDDPDPQDPMVLVGTMLPAGPDAQVEMAYAFAEEFARIGYREPQILALFRRPFYAGAHGAYQDLGEEKVSAIVRECLNVWGRVRLVDHDAPAEAAACDATTGACCAEGDAHE
jgi:hypothetical protein